MALLAATAASAWTRVANRSVNGATVRATGKLCTASPFGTWKWEVRTLVRGKTSIIRWDEVILNDGGVRHLRVTFIGGTFLNDIAPAAREQFKRAAAGPLNRTTVSYVGPVGGTRHGLLVYDSPFGPPSSTPFNPRPGC